jgi:hypothetical protein
MCHLILDISVAVTTRLNQSTKVPSAQVAVDTTGAADPLTPKILSLKSDPDKVAQLAALPIAMVNSISFTSSEFDKENIGNSFLVEVSGHIYAVTAKHILMLAKTDSMNSVSLGDDLKQWRMHPKNNSEAYLVAKDLLNTDENELLTWENNYDWLVFDIDKTAAKVSPLRIRAGDLSSGETLYVVGWSYGDKGSQPVYTFRYVETSNDFHTTEQVSGPQSLAGLSGAPVVDENGLLVGLFLPTLLE